MAEKDNAGAAKTPCGCEIYTAYLEDLGRIGARQESARNFYLSVISALFVFLASTGAEGKGLVAVPASAVFAVAFIGAAICWAWYRQMESFRDIFYAKIRALERMEDDLEAGTPLKPFVFEAGELFPWLKRDEHRQRVPKKTEQKNTEPIEEANGADKKDPARDDPNARGPTPGGKPRKPYRPLADLDTRIPWIMGMLFIFLGLYKVFVERG